MQRIKDSERQYFIDWLRVGAVALLIPFHTGMIFCGWGFHLMSSETSVAILEQNRFLGFWHMPLFFFLSGVGSYYALGFRSAGVYAKERLLRLFLPFVSGMLIVCPPQLYYERLYKGEFSGSFFQFYPKFFNAPYPEGNLSWQHLWFLLYLFLMSLIALPLFTYFRGERGRADLDKIVQYYSGRATVYLPAIPFLVVQLIARQGWPNGDQNLIGDMDNFIQYMIVFVYGYMFCSGMKFWERVKDNRSTSLVIAVVSYLLVTLVEYTVADRYLVRNPALGASFLAMRTLCTWSWLLAILGYGKIFLNSKNNILKYAVEAALPFYIIHQTVIIAIGFYVLQTGWSVAAKYFFIMTASFAGTLALYDVLVKRWNPVRFIFGMRPEK